MAKPLRVWSGSNWVLVSGVSASGTPFNIPNTLISRSASGSFSIGAIDLDTTASPTLSVGRIQWNPNFGTPEVGLVGGNVTAHIGQHVHAYVTNAEGSPLVKGDVVYLYGASGDRASVKKASNTSDTTSSKTLGVAAEAIGTGQNGFVTVFGVVDTLNLSSYSSGDVLWLSSSAGKFTNIKPSAPQHLVFIGVVARANPGNGQLFVNVQNGYELEELHSVTLTNVTDNDILAYNGSSSLWFNQNLATAIQEVDGVGSGIDADLLDGQQGSYYLDWTNTTNKPDPVIGINLTGNTTGAASATLTDLTNGQISITTNTSFATSASFMNWAGVTGRPTTLSGYGITDAIPVSSSQSYLTRSDANIIYAPLSSASLTGIPIAPTAASGTNTQQIATTAFVRTEVSNLIASAPATLDTLNELATALGNDPNFATSTASAIGQRLLASTASTLYMSIGSTANHATSASSINASLITGTTLPAAIVNSSLTNVGTLGSLTVSGNLTVDTDTLFIDSIYNRVGIRTTSPSATLHVNATSTTAPSLTWGANSGQILRNENSELAIGLSNSSPFPLYFQGRTNTNTSRQIVLQPLGGNVGIGGDPSRTFTVVGTASFTGDISAPTHSGLLLGNAMTASSINSSLITGTTLPSSIVNSSLTSVGTLTALTVSQSSGKVQLNTDAGGSISLGRTDNVASTPYIDFNSSASSVDFDVRIQVSGGDGIGSGRGTLAISASVVNIDSGTLVVDAIQNRVGLGTTTPNTVLEVVSLNSHITARSTGETQQSVVSATDVNYFAGPTFRGTYITQFGASATGTLAGISTTSLGALAFQNANNALIYTNGGTPIIFATLSLERMRITGGGNVGIGTVTPNRTLSVIGSASFTGDISAPTFSGLLLGNAQTASSINISSVTGLASNISTFLQTPTSANLAAAVTDESGAGRLVLSNSASFDGIPTAPTASVGSNTNQIATTAFVYSMLTGIDGGVPSSTYEFSIDGGSS